MKIESARLEGRELILTLPAPAEARKLVYKFKPGEYELTKAVKKRSLNANAYAWVLCEKIGIAVGITKEAVYRKAILDVGSFMQIDFPAEDLPRFKKQWEAQGLGYQVQVVGSIMDTVTVNAYYGSHFYDTQEMARFIDCLIEDARSLDIETMPEEQLKSLLESWR